MGVEKFRSGEAMNAAPVMTSQDQGFERFIRHCARYRRITPVVFPRGVFKFRSVAEAEEAREQIREDSGRHPHLQR